MVRQPKFTADIDTLKDGHLYLVRVSQWNTHKNEFYDKTYACWYKANEMYCFEEYDGKYKFMLKGVEEWVEIETE